MSTDVNVKTLKINQLTEAQYNAAVQGGIIGANELSFITDTNYVETLPSQTGHSGAYLTTNGTDLSWGNLANVAISGEYSDLSNTPVIPSAQVNSDWNATSGVAEILNKPTLATVATTGSYTDLTNTPSLANVATTGSYDDLSNKPTIPAAQQQVDWNATTGITSIINKPNLANIATTGEYSDLVNAPSLANVAISGEYSDLLNTPTIPNVPVVVQDFYVNGTTGAIDCTFSATPTTKTVHTIIGNTAIAGTWSNNVFTPTTADDILNNANGFVVSVA